MSMFEVMAELERDVAREREVDRTHPVEVLGVCRPEDGSEWAKAWHAYANPASEPDDFDEELQRVDEAFAATLEASGLEPDLPQPFDRRRTSLPEPPLLWVVALRGRDRRCGHCVDQSACGDDGVGLRAVRSYPPHATHDWLEVRAFDGAARDALLEHHLRERERLLAAAGVPLTDEQRGAMRDAWRARCRAPLLDAWRPVLAEPTSLPAWTRFAEALGGAGERSPWPSVVFEELATAAQRKVVRAAERAQSGYGGESGHWKTFTVGAKPAVLALSYVSLPDTLRKLFDKLGRKDLRAWLPRGKTFPEPLRRAQVDGAFACVDPLEGARLLVERAGGTLRVEGERFIIEAR
jgi:hypothetical protein